ncbi:MAG: hypothetical protein LWX83_04785 [Anaerolineae bacterium]|nr:hypothetical protein [Anaerolineae bacterium]
MDDNNTYIIQIAGRITPDDIEAFSPSAFTMEQSEAGLTELTIYSDQAGLIGFIRHLHGLGLILLSIKRKSNDREEI